MNTKEHSVKEWHFTFEALPGQVLKIQAETEEKARRILRAKIAAISKEMARWMGRVEGATIPGLMTVAAITEDFGQAVLQEKSDRDKVGARLREKGTDEYLNLASRADTGMRLIEREAITLQPPDDSVLRHTYGRLKEIHGEAYGWDPPEIPRAAASVSRQMRSYVRRWVGEWDLRRLYPGAEICAGEEQEIRPTYERDDGLEQPSEESEPDSGESPV